MHLLRLAQVAAFYLSVISPTTYAAPLHVELGKRALSSECSSNNNGNLLTMEKWKSIDENHWITVQEQAYVHYVDGATKKSKPFQKWAAETWNAGDSVGTCQLGHDSCIVPNCNVFDGNNEKNKLFFASLNGLNTYLQVQRNAVRDAIQNIDLVTASYIEKFLWVPSTKPYFDSFNIANSIVTSVAFGIAVTAGSTPGGFMAKGVGALVTGSLLAARTNLAPPADKKFTELAKLGESLQQIDDKVATAFAAVHDGLFRKARFDEKDFTTGISDILADGKFMGISISEKEVVKRRDDAIKAMSANIVSDIWKSQNSFILQGPVDNKCEEKRKARPKEEQEYTLCMGGKKTTLLYFDPQRGGQFKYPKGSDKLKETFGATPHDVIRSSFASFEKGGFDYTPSLQQDAYKGNKILDINYPEKNGASTEGLWTLPVCQIDNNLLGLTIVGAGKNLLPCECLDFKDVKGVKFRDAKSIPNALKGNAKDDCALNKKSSRLV